MTKITVSQRIEQAVGLKVARLVERYNQETDSKRKIDIKYKLGRTIMGAFIAEVLNLNEKDWKLFLKEQFGGVFKALEDLGTDYVNKRLARGELSIRDIELLAYEGATIDRVSKYKLPGVARREVSKKRIVERTAVLSILGTFSLMVSQAYLSVALEPLGHLNNLVARRFNADQNWVFTVATLATHENLMKKKLAELGVSEQEIEELSRKEGLNPIIRRLEQEITQREKRQVSLGFYQASGPRTVRNQLEHHGYNVKASPDEMRGILRDVLKFEAELFPPPGKTS